jgi:acetyl-CoA acetyltransferase
MNARPPPAQSFEGVALVAPTTVAYSRYSEQGAAWYLGRTLAGAIETAGIGKDEVDGLSVASFSLAPDGVVALSEHFGMTLRWTDQVVGGVIALKRAARAVQAGDAAVVACVAGDTLRRDGFAALVANFSRFTQSSVYPMGGAGPNGIFALITANYMARFGATREDFGRICTAQRYNAGRSRFALHRAPMTIEDYLAARPIAEPLHLYDCVMPCAGGEGFLVMSIERARSLGLPLARVLAAAEVHNACREDAIAECGGWVTFRDALYDMAGVGPRDIDFLETYDDYPVIVMFQLEDLGFCEKGDAPRFVRATPLTFDGGGLPHNTSGGMLSGGQAGAAGGHLGVVEGLRQLTGTAGDNQVPGARIGMVSGYGMATYSHCLSASAAVLARGAA